MTIATVRNGLAKMIFLSWVSLCMFVLVGLSKAPLPASVAGNSSDSTSTSSPPPSQTLGAVQDVINTPSVGTDSGQSSSPENDNQVHDYSQPSFSSAPPAQTEQPIAAPSGMESSNGSRSERSTTQETTQDETPSVTGTKLVCVPGVLCI